MTDDLQRVALALSGGLLTASITSILAPALRARWKRQDNGENERATVEVARIEASDKFQDRLMERVKDLEARSNNANGLCDSVGRLAAAVDRLTAVVAARASDR